MMVDSKTTATLDDKKKARIAYRLARSQRGSGLDADLATAQVAGIVDPADGTLNKDVLAGEFLKVTLPQWAGLVTDPGDSDTFFIDWAIGAAADNDAFKEVFSDTVTAPVDPETFPMVIDIPLSSLMQGLAKPADGAYSLRYRIRQPNDQETTSPSIDLIVDTTPPGEHLEPEQMVLATDQLTQAFLEANQGGLVGTLPDYDNWQPGDKVAFYWVGTPLPESAEELPAPVGVVELASPTNNTVTFPVSAIEASRDEPYYAIYILVDKATNRTSLSSPKRIDVALGLLPDNLKEPVVPLAQPPEKLINLPDARLGVEVWIESFDNWKPADRIEVTWGAEVLRPDEVGSSPAFPISIRVPDLVLQGQYNQANGGDQPTEVSYRILRGVVPSEVKSISVNVNFATIGPDPITDPGWPDPVNDALLRVEVYGQTSNQLNVLTAADYNQPAKVGFRLYDRLQAGEIIDFYWGTSHVAEAQYTVAAGDLAGAERDVEIPWSYIDYEGNRVDLPVHYRIHGPDSENTQHSPDTLVNVDAIVIIPEAPVFEGTSSNGWLNCDSLFADGIENPGQGEPGIRVRVPDLSKYLSDNETVTLHWYGSEGNTGDVPISGTEKDEVIVLGGNHPAIGFIWLVTPYDKHILPIYNPAGGSQNGSARIRYSFSMGGETITSLETTARVGMYDANGSCPLRPNPKKK
ncbi:MULTISPECIES: hypothetical protein [Pseudomonas syringae group]|uniref:hypothetical protein n=1 Tax=Pseudomonas syringae group TaxID=136849 RepID=UPI0007303067|nr:MULTISPECIES: hypothetical protein [Pseudomonas syringae group]KTC06899.1 hypothetical protein AO387_12915 [Pseudomonas syringae ICMP 11168]PBP56040.1 hypothetical protein CCL10_09585 [Pseudomonas syringae]